MKKGTVYCLALGVLIVLLLLLNLVKGSIDIPVADVLRILMGDDEGVKPSWQIPFEISSPVMVNIA